MFRLLFLGNGWADFVEIWYALGNPLVTAYAVVTDGVSLHVRTCRPRFCISGTAWPIEFNFGAWVSSRSAIFGKMTNRNQTDTNEMATTETKYQTDF